MGCSSDPKTKEDNKVIKTPQNENKPNEVKKEEKQERKEEIKKEEIKQETNIPTQPKQSSFNKELCKSISNDLPKRTQTTLQDLKNIIQSKTTNLSDKEKCFIVFLWITDNISYDADSFFAFFIVDVTPEGVFRNGLTVCSGYARPPGYPFRP